MNGLLISLRETLDTIGLKYLYYSLLARGHQSTILYLPRFDPRDGGQLNGIGQFVAEIRPGLIGVSLMNIEYHNAGKVTGYLKSLFPAVPIIWGGIHPTG